MRTQLRRQAAAHSDHLRDVIKVQEQEIRAEAEQASFVFSFSFASSGSTWPGWHASRLPWWTLTLNLSLTCSTLHLLALCSLEDS